MVRRFKGATLNDETTGALIVYDNNTDVFTVDSGAANRSATNPGGRIRALLSPRVAPPVPGAAAAPSAPATVLRPSPGLNSGANPKAP